MRKTSRIAIVVAAAFVAANFPMLIQAQESVLHAAISHWLEGSHDAALLVVKQSVLAPDRNPGASRGENAALRNLGARIYYQRYRWLKSPRPDEAKAMLGSAEVFAAAAVWEQPYDLTYWGDYVRIAAERRVVRAPRQRRLTDEQAVVQLRDELLQHNVRYPDLGKDFALTATPELRHIGNAVIHRMQDDVLNAERILESWVSVPVGRSSCFAAVVLVEMQLDVDRFTAARQRVDRFLPICIGAAGAMLANRDNLLNRGVASLVSQNFQSPETYLDRPRAGDEINVVAPPDAPLDIANRILRDPSNDEDWNQLRDAAGTNIRFLKIYDQLVSLVSEWYGEDAYSAVVRARAYRFIQRGKFEKARVELEKLIESDPENADAELLIAAALIDTDERMDPSEKSERRLDQASLTNPQLAACIDRVAIQPCLDRREACTLGAILCEDATDLIYSLWTRGWALRPTATLQLRRVVAELRTRVQLNHDLMKQIEPRMMAEVHALRENVEKRFAATEARIDVIVSVQLPAIEKQLRVVHQEERQLREQLRNAEIRLRREMNAELHRHAADELAQAVAREAGLTFAEALRVLNSHSADLAALKALRPEVPGLMNGEWERMTAQIAQLSAAVRKLEKPVLVAHMEVLQDLENASPEQMINSFSYIVNEIVQMAAMPGTGPLKALKLIPIVKGLSDFLVDAYNERKRNH